MDSEGSLPIGLPESSPIPDLREGEPTGTVVWHRNGLRLGDHPAIAAVETDRLLPLFIFDPAFYGAEGLACDSRLAFLHECLQDLDGQYRGVGGGGLSYAHGDPVAICRQFADRGWQVIAAQQPTGRYGRRRDRAAAHAADVEFVHGDGLRRSAPTRADWSDHIEAFLTADPHDWNPDAVEIDSCATGVTIPAINETYEIEPTKQQVPTGGTAAGWKRLASFVDDIDSYPESISDPMAARAGTSGLSPYLAFGCLSVRQVYQYVIEHAPETRAREMFISRLFWNRHYTQKLADWHGWLDTAVNPVLEGFNRDRYDPALVAAWKAGETGFPMVDASMRCLAETGWLNFRMRAMCASAYFHLLQQPWQIGADHFYHELIDADAAINYTQWQSQCGLLGVPGLRLYNPRKQVRDHEQAAAFIRRWVPELEPLPAEQLDQPESTPPHIQEACGVEIGEGYPYPVVEYESAREEFTQRYSERQAEAAAALADPAVAARASLSGGRERAAAIADEHGEARTTGSQSSLDQFET